MAIQIGAKPDSGFDDPIGMLKDCHRRIESFLGILCVVVDRAQGRSLADEERNAVKAALEYFRTGGQRHTADEEESLFPRLRKSNAKSFEEIDRLEDEHREANDLHGSVERLYSAWIESGGLGSEEAQSVALPNRATQATLFRPYPSRGNDRFRTGDPCAGQPHHRGDRDRISFPKEVALCGIFLMPAGSTRTPAVCRKPLFITCRGDRPLSRGKPDPYTRRVADSSANAQ